MVKAQDQTDQIINQQQQKLQDDERNREIENAKKERIKTDETKVEIEKKEDEICFDIKEITLEGTLLF